MKFLPILQGLVKAFFPRITFDSNGIIPDKPAIFIANHEGSFGPIASYLYFPVRIHPWVMYELTEKGKCARYLEKEFFHKEHGLRPPLSGILARLIEPLCRALFRSIGVVPVYHDSRRIIETISRSIVLLEDGQYIMIFPEIPEEYLNKYINRFNTGFIEIARETGKHASQCIFIYPVCIDRRKRLIRLGHPISFNYANNFIEEKRRIRDELERAITRMKSQLSTT